MALPVPILSFLRSLGLPRISTLKHFGFIIAPSAQKGYTSSQILSTRSDQKKRFKRSQSPIKVTTVPKAPAQPIVAPPATEDPSSTTQQPYHVSRTPSYELPVYLEAKRGGNLHQTRIRKISGDIDRLKDEIQEFLQLPDDRISINRLTRHVVLKGWYKPQVKSFLESKRF